MHNPILSCARLRRIGANLLAWACLEFFVGTVVWSQVLPPEPRVRPAARQVRIQLAQPSPVTAPPHVPDYWVISSRHCKDELEVGLPCDFNVYRFDNPAVGRSSSVEELLASLSPRIPVCFMVHGSFVVWESMLADSAGTYRWLRGAAPERRVQMIFYTWPSEIKTKLLPNAINFHDARIMGRRAELNSVYLANLVSRIPETNPVCLIGHSHGARMVSATLHMLAGGMVEGQYLTNGMNPNQRIRAVLAAAAMDHDWFNPGERFDLALGRAEVVVNLKNRHDLPLIFHPTHQLFAAQALGRTGVTRRDDCLLGDSSCHITDCDVTALVGCRHYWPNYYRRPEIAAAIRRYVYFDD